MGLFLAKSTVCLGDCQVALLMPSLAWLLSFEVLLSCTRSSGATEGTGVHGRFPPAHPRSDISPPSYQSEPATQPCLAARGWEVWGAPRVCDEQWVFLYCRPGSASRAHGHWAVTNGVRAGVMVQQLHDSSGQQVRSPPRLSLPSARLVLRQSDGGGCECLMGEGVSV